MAQPLFDVVCLALEMRQFLEIVLVEPQSADCRVGTRGKYIYSRISKQRIELPTFLQILPTFLQNKLEQRTTHMVRHLVE